MNYRELQYWQNFIDNNISFELKLDSYIIHYSIVNMANNIYYEEWIPICSSEKLCQFIKYIALPSGYSSKALSEETDRLFLYAISDKSTKNLIEESSSEMKNMLIENFLNDYESIIKIEKNFSFEDVEGLCKSYNKHLGYKYGLYSELKIFRNIKEAGIKLVNEYEKDNSLDYLEERIGKNKDELLFMFSTLDENPFLIKKIIPFLNSKILI